MKHPVSVEELLELHRLGELYMKWASNPFAMSETDLENLQQISDEYAVNGTSALFAFQKQFQSEFNMTVQSSQPLVEAIEQAMKPEAMARLHEALRNVPETPMEQTAYIVPIEVRERRELTLAEIAEREKQDEIDILLKQAAAAGEPQRELDLLLEAKKIGAIPPGAWARIKFLEKHCDELGIEVALEVHEDNAIDREAQAAHRADQLRSFREQLDGEMSEDREIEILREISNVDELTRAESARFDELVKKKVRSENSGTHKIPADVLSEAVSGSK